MKYGWQTMFTKRMRYEDSSDDICMKKGSLPLTCVRPRRLSTFFWFNFKAERVNSSAKTESKEINTEVEFFLNTDVSTFSRLVSNRERNVQIETLYIYEICMNAKLANIQLKCAPDIWIYFIIKMAFVSHGQLISKIRSAFWKPLDNNKKI